MVEDTRPPNKLDLITHFTGFKGQSCVAKTSLVDRHDVIERQLLRRVWRQPRISSIVGRCEKILQFGKSAVVTYQAKQNTDKPRQCDKY